MIGAVFTPAIWADWALNQMQTLSRWHQGQTVCDPTGGEGIFLLSLVRQHCRQGLTLSSELLQRLFLIEKEQLLLSRFQQAFRQEFSLDFPSSNLICTDVITDPPPMQFDNLVGNPPWINFTELSPSLKKTLAPHFIESGLVRSSSEVLLGASRVDLAALILSSAFRRLTKTGAQCGFFLPASLFFNDGAHAALRQWLFDGVPVKLECIYDFQKTKVFPGIRTRFCFVQFLLGQETVYPIPYFAESDQGWQSLFAAPVGPAGSPLSVKTDTEIASFQLPQIHVEAWQKPRQGINTCGATDVFVFSQYPDHLNPEYLFPLVTTRLLRGTATSPEKYILLPYHSNGRPLSEQELRKAGLFDYLLSHRERLSKRRGVLIGAAMKKGSWWSLLGVGPYCFVPAKVVWPSFGNSTFRPKVLASWNGKPWQANQALQAFLPVMSVAEGERIVELFACNHLEAHLQDQRMAGTCNWAQPGRIRRFLSFAGQ